MNAFMSTATIRHAFPTPHALTKRQFTVTSDHKGVCDIVLNPGAIKCKSLFIFIVFCPAVYFEESEKWGIDGLLDLKQAT